MEEHKSDVKQLTSGEQNADTIQQESGKGKTAIFVIVAVLIIALLGTGIYFMASGDSESTAKIRDIFIVLLALQMIVIGIALVVLIIQLATLTNLLQNEVKPILTSGTETVNTLKGTVKFLSNNLAEPVIKLNESVAKISKLVELFKFRK